MVSTNITVTNITVTQDTRPLTTLPTEAKTTINQVVTTALPPCPGNAVIGVVIAIILVTVAVLCFLLYRYFCHNKGDYRTTGELAPGEDPDEEHNQAESEKKEYFI